MLEDPLAELLFALELVVERDVADRGGQVRREVEERLRLGPAVARADDGLAHHQDGHELAVREQRHREDALEQLELPDDVGVGQVVDARRPSLAGEPLHEPGVGG